MDLSKAFDSVKHTFLLRKLHYYGIRGIALDFFKCYFLNRKQFVVNGDCKSADLNIKSGVPQGSIIGPLLFILFINDIVYSSNISKFVLYADDTSLVFSSTDLNALINTVNLELSKVALWFNCNHLTLNLNKTNYMMLHTRRARPPASFPPIRFLD